MKRLPMAEEIAVALKWLNAGQGLDPVLLLFSVLELVEDHAVSKNMRSEARVVSQQLFEPGHCDREDQNTPRTFAIIAGRTLLGADGTMGWSSAHASRARQLGLIDFVPAGTYETEQFSHTKLYAKSYLPKNYQELLAQTKKALIARQEALEQSVRMDAQTPAVPSNPSRFRL